MKNKLPPLRAKLVNKNGSKKIFANKITFIFKNRFIKILLTIGVGFIMSDPGNIIFTIQKTEYHNYYF